MRYKPNFCNNCGEKIERPQASFKDSTRFCDVCKHDFIGHRAAPFVFMLLATLFGMYGIGILWREGHKPPNVAARQVAANPVNQIRTEANQTKQTNAGKPTPVNAIQANTAQAAKTTPGQRDNGGASREPVYFCGAETKKGTACSRRVKGGGRCWQHKGQTAVLPAEKLSANQ